MKKTLRKLCKYGGRYIYGARSVVSCFSGRMPKPVQTSAARSTRLMSALQNSNSSIDTSFKDSEAHRQLNSVEDLYEEHGERNLNVLEKAIRDEEAHREFRRYYRYIQKKNNLIIGDNNREDEEEEYNDATSYSSSNRF